MSGECQGRKDDVGGFAFEVLGIGNSAYGSVEGGTAVAAGDDNRNPEVLSQWLQNLLAEVPEIVDD